MESKLIMRIQLWRVKFQQTFYDNYNAVWNLGIIFLLISQAVAQRATDKSHHLCG